MTRRDDDPRAARRHHGSGGAPVGALRPPVSPASANPAATHARCAEQATDGALGAHVGRIVGASAPMRRLRASIARYHPLTAPVLVLGETGSGKELAARGLHRDGPYVAINCAAIPHALVEAELFGCAAGAFTGAVRRDGAFVQADGGTLLLDEIGDLPIAAQGVLLRVIETGVVTPVGGRQRRVSVRIVAATHRDLRERIAEGGFRADLYHRLAALVVCVPPLREHIDDLADIARAVCGDGVDRLTPDAWAKLRAHAWTGNVRELRNVLTRALADAVGSVRELDVQLEPVRVGAPLGWDGPPLQAVVASTVRAAVAAHGGNVRAASRALAISPTTAYRHLAER